VSGVILLALAPVFFVMALGYAAGRRGMVDNHHVEGLNTLVMVFAVPASLFVATASASRREMLAQAPLFAIAGVVMLLVYGAWYIAARVWWRGGRSDASLQALTVAFPNLAGVGLPIASTVFGPAGTIQVAVALAAGSVLVSPLTLAVVELDTRNDMRTDAIGSSRRRVMAALRRALAKPVVFAPALGILVSLSGLTLDPTIEACLALIGHTAAGVALFLTGVVLSAQPFRVDWEVVAATVMGDLVRPILTAALVFSLPVSAELARAAILLAAVPSGFFGILFAVNYRRDAAATGSMVTASTAVSVVTMAIVIATLFPR
jgi:malonate transporter and related proteins